MATHRHTEKVWKCQRGHVVQRKGQRAERRECHGFPTWFAFCGTCKAVKPIYCEKAGRIDGRYKAAIKPAGAGI